MKCTHCHARRATFGSMCEQCARGVDSLYGAHEIARVSRRHVERLHGTARQADEVQEGMFDDCKPTDSNGQVQLF